MRTNSEIKQAISCLNTKGDRTAAEQINVLHARMTESKVFQAYVVNVGEDNRDEAMYYACRDAAQFLSGTLSLCELTGMSAEECASVQEVNMPADIITLSREDYDTLIARIERLEKWTGFKRKEEAGSLVPKPLPLNMDITKLMSQNEACKLLRCGKNTIKRYASRGLIRSYKKGKNTYYIRQELIDKIINRKMADNE